MTATEWAESVLARDVVAGPHVRDACRRHVADLERTDIAYADWPGERFRQFCERHVVLTRGKWRGQPLRLLPWQVFVAGSILGWTRVGGESAGTRRFRTAYVETAKGSGKSPLAAALALYYLTSDGEPEAEVYVSARTEEQGRVAFGMASTMVAASPTLRRQLVIMGGTKPRLIRDPESGSRMELLAANSTGAGFSGPNPSMVLADEYHEHESDRMWQWLVAGFKDRRSPLGLIITNSGESPEHHSWNEHLRAIEVAAGTRQADSHFGFVCGLDKHDDPAEDEGCWGKANPSLPTIPGMPYIREQVERMLTSAADRAHIERLIFCRWGTNASPWLDRDVWMRAESEDLSPEADRAAAPCYMGLDLAMRHDLTGCALVWDMGGGRLEAEVGVFTPSDSLASRSLRDHVPYDVWAKAGDVVAFPGPTLDMARVGKWIADRVERYDVRGLAYDKYRMDQIELELSKLGLSTARCASGIVKDVPRGTDLVLWPHQQGGIVTLPKPKQDVILNMPRSVDALEAALLESRLTVRRNIALRAAMMGATIRIDRVGNRWLVKDAGGAKIDAAVALAMATGLAIALASYQPPPPKAELMLDIGYSA